MTKKKPSLARASVAVQEAFSGLNIDIKGVARLDDLKGTRLEESALKLLPSARSIVALGIEVWPEFLDLTSPEMTAGAANLNNLYSLHVDYLAGRLNRAAYEIAEASRQAGLKALPLPSRNTPTDHRTLVSIFSYKHAAEAAGLGQIGMSSLLVTPEFGPRIRLTICLTEAGLKSTKKEYPPVCHDCNICIVKCPAHALDWPKNEERYAIDKFACRTYLEGAGGCSECMRACPIASPIYS